MRPTSVSPVTKSITGCREPPVLRGAGERKVDYDATFCLCVGRLLGRLGGLSVTQLLLRILAREERERERAWGGGLVNTPVVFSSCVEPELEFDLNLRTVKTASFMG